MQENQLLLFGYLRSTSLSIEYNRWFRVNFVDLINT